MAECASCKHYGYKEICKDCHSNNVLYEPYKGGGWISVKDRLPSKEDINGKSELVLAIHKEDQYVRGWFWDIVATYPDEFTHWMPLPLSPKGE